MSADDEAIQPNIPLAVLRRMVPSMTPEAVRRLPVASLPDEIPLDMVEAAAPDMRAALEELALAVGSRGVSHWGGDTEDFGGEVAAALEEANRHRSHDETERFQQAVRDLAAEWRKRHRDFGARLEQIAPRVDTLRQEQGRLVQAMQRIDDAIEAHGPADRLASGRARLAADLERIEAALSSYYALNFQIARAEMRSKREEIEGNAFEDARLRERIEVLHQRLEHSQSGLRRRLRPGVARRERERLQHRIHELTQERRDREWVIAESDMTRWLDAVVDASIYARGPKSERVLGDGRLQLFHLLNQFCGQQEAAATQVAQNPFLQLDPQQTIEFLLVSERFIVQYFSRKRSDLTRWVGGEARRKLSELDDVQGNILAEYRRHRKLE